jgi:hypothetical protein
MRSRHWAEIFERHVGMLIEASAFISILLSEFDAFISLVFDSLEEKTL